MFGPYQGGVTSTVLVGDTVGVVEGVTVVVRLGVGVWVRVIVGVRVGVGVFVGSSASPANFNRAGMA